MARYSEEQKKDFKFKVYTFLVFATVAVVVAAVGPGIEKMFLKPALDKKTEPGSAQRVLQVARTMEWTARRRRAQEIYETDFYFNWRGDEAKLQGMKDFVEKFYGNQDNPEDWGYFLHWRIAPFLHKDDGTVPPPWVGGDGAKPHQLFPKGMLYLARIYEDNRDYTPMRHILRALEHCFTSGEFTQAEEKVELEEALKRDAVRSF